MKYEKHDVPCSVKSFNAFHIEIISVSIEKLLRLE